MATNRQNVGRNLAPYDEALSPLHQRKDIERGYLICLDLAVARATDNVQLLAAKAILALLDAQPGMRHERLFRGHAFDPHRSWDEAELCGVSQPPDRLARDEVSDLDFILAVAEERQIDLIGVFRRLYDFIASAGGDTRPVWRQRNELPWPFPDDLLTFAEAVAAGLRRDWLEKMVREGRVAGCAKYGRRTVHFFWRVQLET
jgi:hypothetical protein